jgi:hypothetical protein
VKRLALLVAAPALATLSCAVGSGTGSAAGSLFVLSCYDHAPFNFGATSTTSPTTVAPIVYKALLAPEFFAGIPNDDLEQGPQAMNQLEFRMQSTGLLQMYTDTLEFDVINSYEVARCIRGRTVGGQPDYLVNEPLPLTLATAANPTPSTLWCDWSGMAFSTDGGAPDAAMPGVPDAGTALDGGMSMTAFAPRIHLTPYTDIHATLSLGQTCPGAITAGIGMDGWIQFQSFGSAEQSDRAPADRDPISIDPPFLINYGDRLHANFDVIIGDPQVSNAVQNGTAPPTIRVIGGELAGFIDFDLARGRSAQPFP